MAKFSSLFALFMMSIFFCPLLAQSLHPQGLFSSISSSSSPRLAYTLGELAVIQFPDQGGPSIQHGYLPSVIAPITITSLRPVSSSVNTFILFPNPVGEWLTLQSSEALTAPLSIMLHDVQGRIISTSIMSEGQESLNLHVLDIPSGLHLLSITHPSGVQLHTFQIVKH